MILYKTYVKLCCILMYYFLRKNSLALEDFRRWIERYGLTSGNFASFVHLMQNYPEYRYVFYFRLHAGFRFLFNLLLPKLKTTRISTKCVMGGGISLPRLLFYYCS